MPPTAPLRIAHPHSQLPYNDRARVQSNIDPKIEEYLFKRILPEAGHQAAMIAIFFDKVYTECVRRGIGMPTGVADPKLARWDEDLESKVAQVLLDMNFDKAKPKKVKP